MEAILLSAASILLGFIFGWLAKAVSLEESTDYGYVSADCPNRPHLSDPDHPVICGSCGYDPSLPEGERETV